MTSPSLARRTVLAVGIGLTLIALVVGVIYLPQVSFAQDDATSLVYGDVVEGVLGNGTATYTFTAEAGDMVEIHVLAFGFAPNVDIQSEDGSSLLADDMTASERHVAMVNWVAVNGGTYSIVITGAAPADGHFALSLEQTGRLAEGSDLTGGETLTSEVLVPVVYKFSGDPDNAQVLTVRSTTEGFRPLLMLLNGDGETLADVHAPSFLSTVYVIEPSDDDYILVIQKGDFDGSANVEVSLSGGDDANAGDGTTQPTVDASAQPTMDGSAQPTVDMTTTVEPTVDMTTTVEPTIDMTTTVEPTIDLTLTAIPTDMNHTKEPTTTGN